MMKLPIAAQVYSVREQAAADFDAAMGELARMGYDGVELAGLYGKSPEEILEILDRRGLKAVSAHVPFDEFVKDLEGTVEAYRKIGCQYVAVPYLGGERWYGGSGYQETLSFLAVIAEKCKAAGMQLLYHNHAHEFARTEALATELDLCWVKVGGADPAEYLHRYSGRCPLVHMKDFVRDGEVTLVALGDGELDVGAAAAQAAESGAKWLVVEQDDHHFGSPMENMKKSIDCLKKL